MLKSAAYGCSARNIALEACERSVSMLMRRYAYAEGQQGAVQFNIRSVTRFRTKVFILYSKIQSGKEDGKLTIAMKCCQSCAAEVHGWPAPAMRKRSRMLKVRLRVARRSSPSMSANDQDHCQRVKSLFAEGEQGADQTQSNLWTITSFRAKLVIITRAEGGKEDVSLTIKQPSPKLRG